MMVGHSRAGTLSSRGVHTHIWCCREAPQNSEKRERKGHSLKKSDHRRLETPSLTRMVPFFHSRSLPITYSGISTLTISALFVTNPPPEALSSVGSGPSMHLQRQKVQHRSPRKPEALTFFRLGFDYASCSGKVTPCVVDRVRPVRHTRPPAMKRNTRDSIINKVKQPWECSKTTRCTPTHTFCDTALGSARVL